MKSSHTPPSNPTHQNSISQTSPTPPTSIPFPKIPAVYRHFKGQLYLTEDIIYHSETGEPMVAYRALYGDYRLYCRPLAMFTEPLDPQKYPSASQTHRFELVHPNPSHSK